MKNLKAIAGRRRRRGGFSLAELMVAVGVVAIGLGSIVAMNGWVTNALRRGNSASYASQLIQERMEQFRRAAWTDITSNYPPGDANDAADYDNDTNYIDDDYPSEFPYDIADIDSLEPGLMDLMAVPTSSASQLQNVVETVTVETYNASNSPLTIFDADGSNLTIQPFSVGGTPIIVQRANGVVTKVSHNAVIVLNTTVRMTLRVSWRGSDGRTRTKETVTLFTVEGDK
jgi:prepilin-type N-terminal cleavage/methylation domain-containing protein